MPYSSRHNLELGVPTHQLAPGPYQSTSFSQAQIFQQDGPYPPLEPHRFGVEQQVDLGLNNAGQWVKLPNGDRLWTLRIHAEEATSLNLVYDDFYLPDGAEFYIYNDDRSQVLGPFTARNNKAHGGFATGIIAGEAITLEYIEPANVLQPGRLHVSTAVLGTEAREASDRGSVQVGQFATASASAYVPEALPCSINTACHQGGWRDEINATVKILMGGDECSGVLLNNVREDERPYILTANHCGGATEGETVDWVFEFNYQSATCGDPEEDPVAFSIAGAVVRAADGGGADFTLLELLEPIPESYDVTFAGWSVEEVVPTSGTVIGHPKGDIKKITFDDDALQDALYFWLSTFDRGSIEGGSSGSPLFNEEGQVVGHVRSALGADFDACTGPGGDDNAAYIVFPKLSYIWDMGVSDYLDPEDTGTASLGSREAGAPPPSADLALSMAVTNLDVVECAEGDDGCTETINASFEIVVTNDGPNSAEDIEIVETADDAMEILSTLADRGTFNEGTDRWYVGTLESGNRATLTVDASVPAKGFWIYTAELINSSLPDPDSAPNDGIGDDIASAAIGERNPSSVAGGGGTVTTVYGSRFFADLGLVMWADYQTVTAGEIVNYTITVNNAGPYPTSGVVVTALLPECLSFLGADLSDRTDQYDPATGQWKVGQLKLNQNVTLVITADTGACSGSVETTASITSSNLPDPDSVNRFPNRSNKDDIDTVVITVANAPGKYSSETEVALLPSYPNPFNPETVIPFTVPEAMYVRLAVYDLLGRRIQLLVDGNLSSGNHEVAFRASALPTGVYLVRMEAAGAIQTQHITLMK